MCELAALQIEQSRATSLAGFEQGRQTDSESRTIQIKLGGADKLDEPEDEQLLVEQCERRARMSRGETRRRGGEAGRTRSARATTYERERREKPRQRQQRKERKGKREKNNNVKQMMIFTYEESADADPLSLLYYFGGAFLSRMWLHSSVGTS